MIGRTAKALKEIRFGIIMILLGFLPFFLVHCALLYGNLSNSAPHPVRVMLSEGSLCISSIIFVVLFLVGWINTLIGLILKSIDSGRYRNTLWSVLGTIMWTMTVPLIIGAIVSLVRFNGFERGLFFIKIFIMMVMAWMVLSLMPHHIRMGVSRYLKSILIIFILSSVLGALGAAFTEADSSISFFDRSWPGVMVLELAFLITMVLHIIAFSKALWAKPRVRVTLFSADTGDPHVGSPDPLSSADPPDAL